MFSRHPGAQKLCQAQQEVVQVHSLRFTGHPEPIICGYLLSSAQSSTGAQKRVHGVVTGASLNGQSSRERVGATMATH